MPNRLIDIELWKADRSAEILLPESLYNSLASPPHFVDVFGLKSEVQLTLYAGCQIATASEEEEYRLSQGKLLRFIYDDDQIKEYRITQGNREFSGQSDRTVTAKSIENDLQSVTVRKTLANGHIRASVSFYKQSFSDIAGKLLSSEYNCPDYFELGNVPASFDEDTYNLNLSGAYLIAGLKELCSNAGGEWDVSYNSATDSYQVDFYESGKLGGGQSEAGQRILGIGGGKGNRLKMNRQDETDRYFSRIVPLMGQDNQTRTMAGAKWHVETAAFNDPNSEIALSDRAIAKDGYGLIQGQTVYFGNETEGWHEVQATTAPNGLTLTGDASGLNYGYFRTGANKDDVVFLEDAAALENIGLKEEKFARTDIGPYANLVEDAGISAALSEWSNGMPEGFAGITGNETVSQESNDLFVKHGVLSAKVKANTDEGIETIAIDIEPEDLNPYFSLQTYLQAPSGSVRIEIEDSQGNIYPTDEKAETNSPETIGLAIGGEEIPAGTATIKFIANEDNTVFYVDALAFTQSGSPQPYKALMGPRALWMEAGRYLKRYGGDRPDVWQGEGMDMAFFDGGEEIEIGSWVTVQEDYNEDTGEYDTEKVLRVIELSYDEHRINGRFRKTVKLASERSDASRYFQDQFVTNDDLQAGVSVDHIPNKNLYDRGEQERLDGLLGDLDQNLGDLNQQLGNLDDQINAPGGLVEQLNTLDTQINGTGGLDERLEDAESNVSTLQTNLGDLDTELGSLDTILGDPLGNGLTSDQWFETIATNQAWINKFVANEGYMREATIKDAYIEEITLDQGFFNSLAGSELWANTGTFNNAFVDNITGNSGFFENLTASDLWSETATFDQAFIDVMSSNKIWSDQVVANTMFAKDLSVYEATLGNWEAFTNTIESVDQFQGIRMNSAVPEIGMLTPNVTGTDEYNSLVVSPTAPIPSSVEPIMNVSRADTSGTITTTGSNPDAEFGEYTDGSASVVDDGYAMIVDYELSFSNVQINDLGSYRVAAVVQASDDNGSTWTTLDFFESTVLNDGDNATISVSNNSYNVVGYTDIRAGFILYGAPGSGSSGGSFDYSIIGQTFRQYKSKVVVNEKGIFQRVSPNIVKSLADSGSTHITEGSAGSLLWGSIEGTLSDQSDLQNVLDGKVNISDESYIYGDNQRGTINTNDIDGVIKSGFYRDNNSYSSQRIVLNVQHAHSDGHGYQIASGYSDQDSLYHRVKDGVDWGHWNLLWTDQNVSGDSNIGVSGTTISLANIPSVDAIDLANNEMDSFTESGRLYHDESAGVYVKSVNANHDNPALLWSSANFTDGNNLTVSYGSEDEPTLSVVDNPSFSANITLERQGVADSNTDYNSSGIRFQVSGWDTNNGYQRTDDWFVRGEAHESNYPDMNLVFRSPNSRLKAFELYGYGSTNSLPPTVAEFYGAMRVGGDIDLQSEGDLVSVNNLNVSSVNSNNSSGPIQFTQGVNIDDSDGNSASYLLNVQGQVRAGSNIRVDGDIHFGGNAEITSGDENTSARIIARALSNPDDGNNIFAVEPYGSSTRFGVTQNHGTWATDGIIAGVKYDSDMPNANGNIAIGGVPSNWDDVQDGFYSTGRSYFRTAKLDTLIVDLFKKNEIQVMKSDFLFSDGTKTSEDYSGGSLELHVEENVFQNGDYVAISWENSDGSFGRNIIEITSGWNSGYYDFATVDWEQGYPADATAVRITDDYIFLNGDESTISGYEGISNYAQSPFSNSGSMKEPVWELSPTFARLAGGILEATPSGVTAAGFDIQYHLIVAGSLSSGAVKLLQDNSVTGGSYNGTPSGIPTISLQKGSDPASRTFIHMGETYDGSWTGNWGFSFSTSKNGDAEFLADETGVFVKGTIEADNGYLGALTVQDTLTVTGGNTFIGKGVYDGGGVVGPVDGIYTQSTLISRQGIDIDARSGTGGQIEFHNTGNPNGNTNLNSNSNLVGEIQVNINDSQGLSSLSFRAQSISPDNGNPNWDSEISFAKASWVNFNTNHLREVGIVQQEIDQVSLGSGEVTLDVTAPVMEITGGDSGTRIVEVNIQNEDIRPGQTIKVINRVFNTSMHWRDSSTTTRAGANVAANNDADYEHFYRSAQYLTVGSDNEFYVHADYGS